MNKVIVLCAALLLTHVAVAQPGAARLGAALPQRPNILLLMSEDMSARVGAFGDPVAVTPTLDALAREGVRYPNTFTTAGVCAPSRAAHILGMNQATTGTQHMRSSTRPAGGYFSVPPEGVKAYPELLRAAGYYTYTDQKLDYQFSSVFPNSGPATIWDNEGEARPTWRGRKNGQPFFGFRNFMVTHESGVFRPLGSMPEGVSHFVMQLMRWWRLDESPPEVVSPIAVKLPPYYPDTPVVRADLARHYNNIAYMDGEVAEIMRQLEADDLADSTIVIWTTDHGDGLPRAKRELFDSGIKVPMIIRWPEAFRPDGVRPNTVDTRLISFVDLAPTILKLAGVAAPGYLQGHDFAASNAVRREYIFAARDRIDEVPDRQRAVRDQRYKYIRSWHPGQAEGHALAFRDNIDMVRQMREMYGAGKLNAVQSQWFQPPGEERLFDLENDPYEVHNLSRDPAHAGILRRMQNALSDWQQRAGDMGDEPEDKMVARIQPGAEQQVTPAPKFSVEKGRVKITPAAEGYSVAYRLDEGGWRVYSGPIALQGHKNIEAKAVRYGWKESDLVTGP
jgi:N-sulfoglucosamine sulfohydrolase